MRRGRRDGDIGLLHCTRGGANGGRLLTRRGTHEVA